MTRLNNGFKQRDLITQDEFKIIMLEQDIAKIGNDISEIYDRIDGVSALIKYNICAIVSIYIIDTTTSLFYLLW